jgi:hypothetical protein
VFSSLQSEILSAGGRALQEISLLFSSGKNELEGFQFKFKNQDFYILLKGEDDFVKYFVVPTSYFESDSVERLIQSDEVQNTLKRIQKLI